MKKLLSIIVLSLLWCTTTYAEVIYDKWIFFENDSSVRVERLGENDLSGAFTYALHKKNNSCRPKTCGLISQPNSINMHSYCSKNEKSNC